MSTKQSPELKAFLTLVLMSISEEVSDSDDVSTLVHIPKEVLIEKLESFVTAKTYREQRAETKAAMAKRRNERAAEQERVKKRKAEFQELRRIGISVPREFYSRSDKPNP